MSLKMKNTTINKLILVLPWQQQYNLNIDELELENLEVLLLGDNQLKNDQLYNLSKFKKLKILDVSRNNVDLTNIHNVKSLTKLDMQYCRLTSIEQIQELVNLQDLNINSNPKIDIIPVYKVKGLTKLSISECNLQQIDQIVQLTNLQVLDISLNKLKNIDPITPLNSLVGLIKLDLLCCNLVSICALRPLVNLQYLDLSFNSIISITELQYLKNLMFLNLRRCEIISICALRSLVKLEDLDISDNQIVYLDANLNNMKKLKQLSAQINFISDFDSRSFNISNQRQPSLGELSNSNYLRNIEWPNISLVLTQSKRKTIKTTLNQVKQIINAAINRIHSNHHQFSSSAVRLFQQLNEAVSQ
ncbi:Conserved_hypothetical protein [Hexamita inflata]|uniref:Uncharacterized protein n=1 Tax=Hexamita inflata TaxID=28002 RepID=A0AA86U4Q3_9EUKA|nr:Conserved hypothetical protein [Hexamita inflata]